MTENLPDGWVWENSMEGKVALRPVGNRGTGLYIEKGMGLPNDWRCGYDLASQDAAMTLPESYETRDLAIDAIERHAEALANDLLCELGDVDNDYFHNCERTLDRVTETLGQQIGNTELGMFEVEEPVAALIERDGIPAPCPECGGEVCWSERLDEDCGAVACISTVCDYTAYGLTREDAYRAHARNARKNGQ